MKTTHNDQHLSTTLVGRCITFGTCGVFVSSTNHPSHMTPHPHPTGHWTIASARTKSRFWLWQLISFWNVGYSGVGLGVVKKGKKMLTTYNWTIPFAGCECSHNENISANSFSSAEAIHLSDLEHLFVRLLELQRLYRDERDIKITPIYYGRQPHGLKRDCCGQTQVTGDTAHESNTACADLSITTLSPLVLRPPRSEQHSSILGRSGWPAQATTSLVQQNCWEWQSLRPKQRISQTVCERFA